MQEAGNWQLSPAYDLTFSTGPNGEHWTSYGGEGKEPRIANLMTVARAASISEKSALAIIDQVKTAVTSFKSLAKENGVPNKISGPIIKQLDAMLTLVAAGQKGP